MTSALSFVFGACLGALVIGIAQGDGVINSLLSAQPLFYLAFFFLVLCFSCLVCRRWKSVEPLTINGATCVVLWGLAVLSLTEAMKLQDPLSTGLRAGEDACFWLVAFVFPLYWLIHEGIYRSFAAFVSRSGSRHAAEDIRVQVNGVLQWKRPFVDGWTEAAIPWWAKLRVFVIGLVVGTSCLAAFVVVALDPTTIQDHYSRTWWSNSPTQVVLNFAILFACGAVLAPHLILKGLQHLHVLNYTLDKGNVRLRQLVSDLSVQLGAQPIEELLEFDGSARLTGVSVVPTWLFSAAFVFLLLAPLQEVGAICWGNWIFLLAALPAPVLLLVASVSWLTPVHMTHLAIRQRKEAILGTWRRHRDSLLRDLAIDGRTSLANIEALEQRLGVINAEIQRIQGISEWPFARGQLFSIAFLQVLPWAMSSYLSLS